MDTTKSHPTEPPAVEEEQFVSSNEFSTAVSASDWDAVVSQTSGLSIAQSSSAGVSRFERDSLYRKFDPLFSFTKVGASGSAPADRLSSVFKVPKLPEPSQGATAGNGVNGNKEISPATKSATQDEFSSPSSKRMQRCSEASSKYYSPTSDVANTTLYTTAFDTSISPSTDNLEETVIVAIRDVERDVNDEMDQGALPDSAVNCGSGAALEASVSQVVNQIADKSICNDSFLDAFSQTVVISSPNHPPRPVGIVRGHGKRFEADSQEQDLNGSQNVTPPSPLENPNVTRIVVHREEVAPVASASERDEQDPDLPVEDDEEGLAGTETPANLSIMEETVFLAPYNNGASPVQDLEACGAAGSSLSSQPSSVNLENQEIIQRIQMHKQRIIELEEEDRLFCEEADKEIVEKEAKLRSVMEQVKKEKEKLETNIATSNLARNERNQALEDLKSMETSFAELVAMYEALKEVHPKLVQNCDMLNKRHREMEKLLKGKDERDKAASQMVEDCLDVMDQNFQKKMKEAEGEGRRLNAKIRIAELDVQQKEAKSRQLDIENAKLRELCQSLAKDAN